MRTEIKKYSENPKLVRVFFSMGLWHAWNAFSDTTGGFYRTALTRPELFIKLYKLGYHLITCVNTYEFKTTYYFEK